MTAAQSGRERSAAATAWPPMGGSSAPLLWRERGAFDNSDDVKTEK